MRKKKRLRCAYKCEGHLQCPRPPVDARLIPLPNGDHIVALLCDPHTQMVDTKFWAEKKRQEAVA